MQDEENKDWGWMSIVWSMPVLYALVAWLVVEGAFWVFVRWFVGPAVNEKTPRGQLPRLADPWALCLRILDLVDSLPGYSFRDFLSGFFLGSPVEAIRHGDMISFMSWALLYKLPAELSPDEGLLLDRIVSHICARYHLRPKPGCNPAVQHVALSTRPVLFFHRPLVVYLSLRLLDHGCLAILYLCGFSRISIDGFSFLYRPAYFNSATSTIDASPSFDSTTTTATTPSLETTPIVFFHGICPGWLMYIPLLLSFSRHRPLVLLDLDPYKITSLNLARPSADAVSQAVMKLLAREGFSHCSVVGHSFGSVVAAWFLRRYPHAVSHVALLDPVCILLALPHVAANFVFRQPINLVQWCIRLFAAREVTIAHALGRNFWWHQCVLWLDELPPHTPIVVSLSGRDSIIEPSIVQDHLTTAPNAHQIQTVVFPTYFHGQVCLMPAALRILSSTIEASERRGVHWQVLATQPS